MTDLTLHSQPVRHHAVNIINQVFKRNRYPDELIEDIFTKYKYSTADKALLNELVNGTVRWHGYLDWVLSKLFRADYEKAALLLKAILEVSLYQIIFLDKIPDYAAISEGVEIAKLKGGPAWGRLVNAILRNYIRKTVNFQVPGIKDDPVNSLAIQHSHPRWLIERWLKNYGLENTIKYCNYNNKRPEISIRVNESKISRDELIDELNKRGYFIKKSSYFNDFMRMTKSAELVNLELFQNGYFTIQDESTAIPCRLLAPEDDDIIIDMCAAPGGKSCYIANLLEERGLVIAIDVQSKRLQLLKQNVKRLRLKRISIIEADSRYLNMKNANKILIDAPCSGFGVLAKRPDLRWRRTPDDILNIKKIQKKLLDSASNLLKKDGIIVYNTCTLEKEETEDVIHEFLHEHPEFKIDCVFKIKVDKFKSAEGYWRTLPFKHDMDGSFSVRIMRA